MSETPSAEKGTGAFCAPSCLTICAGCSPEPFDSPSDDWPLSAETCAYCIANRLDGCPWCAPRVTSPAPAMSRDKPDAYYCRECGRPTFVGPPEDLCVACGGFDWETERNRGWAS